MRTGIAAPTLALLLLASGSPLGSWASETEAPPQTMTEVLEASGPSDWRPLEPAETLYLELDAGRVVIRLAPEFAPQTVENIRRLATEHYFDGLAIVRSQENYVVQWGDPAAEPEERRSLGSAREAVAAEFDRELGGLNVTVLEDGDVYAPQVGFANGLPVAVDPERGRVWLAHCNSMVGVGRDVAPDSGTGAEMYVVIGHAPRHLDLNVTLVGRVVQGMEHLTTLPRGHAALGFYEDPSMLVPIRSIRVGSDLPESERVDLELLRTDTDTFEALIRARRHRREPWFAHPTGRIGLCNVPLPVRARARGEEAAAEDGTSSND